MDMTTQKQWRVVYKEDLNDHDDLDDVDDLVCEF